MDLSPAVCTPAHLRALSEALGRAMAGAANLKSVKLTGGCKGGRNTRWEHQVGTPGGTQEQHVTDAV